MTRAVGQAARVPLAPREVAGRRHEQKVKERAKRPSHFGPNLLRARRSLLSLPPTITIHSPLHPTEALFQDTSAPSSQRQPVVGGRRQVRQGEQARIDSGPAELGQQRGMARCTGQQSEVSRGDHEDNEGRSYGRGTRREGHASARSRAQAGGKPRRGG